MTHPLIKNGQLHLFGWVGGDAYWGDGFSESDVRAALVEMDGDIEVLLSSQGGRAIQGIGIYNALVSYDGKVTIHIEAIAASAASVVAMAGNTVNMKTGSMMMIHGPAQMTIGTADTHKNAAKALDTIADSATQIYAHKSGRTSDEIRAMMKAETWLSADDAVSMGFADLSGGDAQMSAPSFDYSLFSNAPDAFLSVAAQWKKNHLQPNKQEVIMAKKPAAVTPPATQPDESDVTSAVTETAPTTTAPLSAINQPNADEMSAADRADLGRRILQSNIPAQDGLVIMSEASSVDDGIGRIFAAMEKQNQPVLSPRSTVVRDERDTMRIGMAEAIAAQMSGVEPQVGQAVPFMNMSLVEMAAKLTGRENSPMRTYASREAIMAAGFHATSDFPAIFEDAMNKALLGRYQSAEPTYRQIARRKPFKDFRPHRQIRPGEFPQLQPVGQGGEIKFGTLGEEKEMVSVVPYAIQFAITREMLVNDDLGAIDEVLADHGNEVANFEERTFYAAFLAAKLSNGDPLFHASRKNLAASGSSISVPAVGLGRSAMRKQTGISPKEGEKGRKLNIGPSILLVSPDNETAADQLVANVAPEKRENVNPFSGRLEVVTAAELEGLPWYLMADPSRLPCFVYGNLDGYEAPRLRTVEPFGVQGVGVSLEHDFGAGATDYRGAYKNPGATS